MLGRVEGIGGELWVKRTTDRFIFRTTEWGVWEWAEDWGTRRWKRCEVVLGIWWRAQLEVLYAHHEVNKPKTRLLTSPD